MKKSDVKFYVYALICGVCLIIFSSYLAKYRSSKFTDLEDIENLEDIVKESYRQSGMSYLKLKTCKVKAYCSVNDYLNPNMLGEFVKKGDRLVKQANQKFVSVYRDSMVYTFALGNCYYWKPPKKIGEE